MGRVAPFRDDAAIRPIRVVPRNSTPASVLQRADGLRSALASCPPTTWISAIMRIEVCQGEKKTPIDGYNVRLPTQYSENRGRIIMRLTSIDFIVLGACLSLITACGKQTSSTAETEIPDSAEVTSQAAESTPDDASVATTLSAQLEEQQAEYAKMAPAYGQVMDKAITDLTASGILDQAIKAGDNAPDFTLPDALGNMVSLYEELKKGPVILTWYRGSWCPYCNLQLHDYQTALGDIHAVGAQLFAVSPELPDSTLSWKEKNELEFIVLSDLGNKVAREYGIVYRIPDAISASYRKDGRIDLAKFNGDDSLELPLAVTYVIGTDRMVEYAFLDTDYRKRAETNEIVEVVTRLAENSK